MSVDVAAEGTKNICGISMPEGNRFVHVTDGVQLSIVTTFPPELVLPSSTEATSRFPLDTK